MKGALLSDGNGVLIQHNGECAIGAPDPVHQYSGYIRYGTHPESLYSILKAYIHEAIEVEKAGLKVPLKKTKQFATPEEFQSKLDKIPALKTAFYALTPGRQRGYLLYFSSAKQAKTREARIEKCMQQILNGKGLDD